jgi:hypothetical protein
MEDTKLIIPRGALGLPPQSLQMGDIYAAENRLMEVAIVNPRTVAELMATFNYAANLVTKYMGWISWDLLTAKKQFDLCKAEVILDKMPEAISKLRDMGIKNNEDFRNAMIARDPNCSAYLDVINTLTATYELLESKSKSFIRAYYTCQDQARNKDQLPYVNANRSPGFANSNIMGEIENKD